MNAERGPVSGAIAANRNECREDRMQRAATILAMKDLTRPMLSARTISQENSTAALPPAGSLQSSIAHALYPQTWSPAPAAPGAKDDRATDTSTTTDWSEAILPRLAHIHP